MNKKKGIIIGAVLFILAVAVGYALFSDTLTINGTATAKGEFAFEITTQKEVADEVISNNMYELYPNNGVVGNVEYANAVSSNVNSSITNTSNTVTYSVNLTQPGQKQYFTVKLTNTGSIPLKFDFWDHENGWNNANTTLSGNLIMDDGKLVDVSTIRDILEGYGQNEYEFSGSDLIIFDQLAAFLTNFEGVYASKDIYDEFDIDDENSFPKLDAGETAYFIFSSWWRVNSNFNEHVKGFDLKATSEIIFPIKQYVD